MGYVEFVYNLSDNSIVLCNLKKECVSILKQFVILIADDSKSYRKILRNRLISWQYKVYEAVDGQQVLEMAAKIQPDLVILDAMMPNLNGYTACERLQEMGTARKTPVILITAHNKAAIEKAFEVGAEEYLTKPIHWNILKYRLQRILAARKAERVLIKKQERSKLVWKTGTDAYWDLDLKTGLVKLGPRSLKILGYSGQKFVFNAKDWYELLHPKDKLRTIRQWKGYLLGRTQKYESEYRLLTPSGRWKWICSRGQVVQCDRQGNPVRIIGVITDIDTRKRAYEALRASEEKLQAIFNNAVVGIGIIDAQGRCIYANQKWTEMLGYSFEEVYQLTFQEYTYYEDYAKCKELLDKAAKREIGEYYIKKRYVRKDKSVFWAKLSASAVYNEEQNLDFIIGVIVDITALNNETEKLRASEERLEETQKIARFGSWEMKVDTGESKWSAETFRILGLEPREKALNFREYLQLVHPDDKPSLLHSTRKAQTAGLPYEIEVRHIQPNRTYNYAVIRCQPVLAGGKVIKLIGSLLDITEHKQAEQHIQRRNELLLALNDVSFGLLNRLDINEVLAMIVKDLVGLFDNASGSLYLLKENGLEVELKFAIGLVENYVGFTQSKDEGLVGAVFATGKPYIVNNYRSWAKKKSKPVLDVPFSMIGLPLFYANQIVGVIHIALHEAGRIFTTDEQVLLERFAGLASIAYDNAFLYNQAQKEIAERKLIEEKLRYMSLHDALTGLYNRAHLENELERIADGSYKSVGIIVCDLDGLKKVNDTLGHAFGDVLITAAGDVLKRSFRKSDTVARIGGDEFAIMLPDADKDIMEAAYQRIKEQVDSYPEFNGIKLRMSVGWVVGNIQDNNLCELFRKADENMYLEKFARKRQVF